jgi:hypothetical protein
LGGVDGLGDKELNEDGGDESREDIDFEGDDNGEGVSDISRVMLDNIAVGIVPNKDCWAGVR